MSLIVVPHRPARAIINRRRGARLLAEIESFAVANDEVALNHAVRAAGQGDARLRAPRPRCGGEAVADDDVVVRVEPEGDFVKDSRILVVGDEALAHGTVRVADVEPNAVAPVPEKSAPLQHSVATQRQLVAAGFPARGRSL